MSISELTSLQNTLNAAIDVFKAELAAQNLPEPSLNTSKSHPIDDIAYLPTPAMFEARRTALASLVRMHYDPRVCSMSIFYYQGLIKSLIQSPYDALAANTWMALEVAGVRLTAEIGLATILGDSENGLTIPQIAEKTSVDGDKLGSLIKLSLVLFLTSFIQERVLRLLITQGWFREAKPGYFANNRLSNLIRKGQPGYHLATYM
jgi:hypothetical protein